MRYWVRSGKTRAGLGGFAGSHTLLTLANRLDRFGPSCYVGDTETNILLAACGA